MNGNTVQRTFPLGSELAESFHRIDMPRQKGACELVDFWNARPEDGIEVGRDIPSRKVARFLSQILIWQPIPGEADMRLHLAGEALRLRFGGNAVGGRFSELVDSKIVPFFLSRVGAMQAQDTCACFDMHLSRPYPVEGRKDLHFEMVVFPVWSPGRTGRWILNGLFYFS